MNSCSLAYLSVSIVGMSCLVSVAGCGGKVISGRCEPVAVSQDSAAIQLFNSLKTNNTDSIAALLPDKKRMEHFMKMRQEEIRMQLPLSVPYPPLTAIPELLEEDMAANSRYSARDIGRTLERMRQEFKEEIKLTRRSAEIAGFAWERASLHQPTEIAATATAVLSFPTELILEISDGRNTITVRAYILSGGVLDSTVTLDRHLSEEEARIVVWGWTCDERNGCAQMTHLLSILVRHRFSKKEIAPLLLFQSATVTKSDKEWTILFLFPEGGCKATLLFDTEGFLEKAITPCGDMIALPADRIG